jgi:Holliday junction resolvase
MNGNAARTRGRSRELAVVRLLREQGYVVYRLHQGTADVAALKAGHAPMLVQVKSTAGGPWERFGPADRDALAHDAITAGADAVLAWWPPRAHEPRLYGRASWPTSVAA